VDNEEGPEPLAQKGNRVTALTPAYKLAVRQLHLAGVSEKKLPRAHAGIVWETLIGL
jgi:hypothetical protein